MHHRESSLEVTNHGNLIQFSVKVPVSIRKEGEWVYSSCKSFDVHGQGKSEEAAVKDVIEALQLFMESCFERGVLEQVLKDCGFKPVSRREKAVHRKTSSSERMIDVPLPLLVANHVQSSRLLIGVYS